jgi:hypothetical protein
VHPANLVGQFIVVLDLPGKCLAGIVRHPRRTREQLPQLQPSKAP